MPVIDIVKPQDKELEHREKVSSWESFFSASCARLFFLFLLLFDAVWFTCILAKLCIYSVVHLLSLGNFDFLRKKVSRNWLSFKRSTICALALVISLFSPAFGIMIGCTYFLMYDKNGIEEVVPVSLRTQFKDVFASVKDD